MLEDTFCIAHDVEFAIFSSPSLVCIETAAALMKQLNLTELHVKDELSDILMKSWFSEDPFPGWTTKLLNNRTQF